MPRPRGGDWLEDEIRSLKRSGVDVVISLLERQEISELDIIEEQALCQKNGISFLLFPITDRSVPSSKREALNFAQSIVDLLRAPEERGRTLPCWHRKVCPHCCLRSNNEWYLCQ